MNEAQLLDELVPPFDEPGDWDDVLRRARRRRPRARVLVAIALAVAAFGVGPALAFELLQHDPVKLPAVADRNNIAVIIQPRTGRILLEIAPWKGHNGFCYALLGVRAGCVPHKTRGTVAMWPPLLGWSFDRRVRSGTATTRLGKTVKLTVSHFGGRIDATVFFRRSLVPPVLKAVTLRDANGAVVTRLRLGR
jgi:hypothetical protein